MGGKQNLNAETTHVSIRVPNDILEFLDAEAESQEYPTTRNAVIVAVLRQHMEGKKGKDKKGGGK